ncbi:MAG: hypothetical protein U1D66_09850 [Erythrobacter sp.]|nr:hypothetical protein [Erythrobacter sp.]
MAGKRIIRSYKDFVDKVKVGQPVPPRPEGRHYENDYTAIRTWFDGRTTWTDDDVRLGCLMVYGWMPTIFRYGKDSGFADIAEAMNEGTIPTSRMNFCNNSYVGTSKFLHFWRPQEFAIWDSRICKLLGWGCVADTAKNFLTYQYFVRKFADELKLADETQSLSLRDIEQSLFRQTWDEQ